MFKNMNEVSNFVVKQKVVTVILKIAIIVLLANNGMVPCPILKGNWSKRFWYKRYFCKENCSKDFNGKETL